MKSHVTDSKFGVLRSYMAGQMGFWGKARRCTVDQMQHGFSNWKGFDPWWEASMKLEGWEDNRINHFEAYNCGGQGFWFDISNHGNTVYKLDIVRCKLAGLMVEHHAKDNKFYDISVDTITVAEYDPDTSWNVTAGILCQSSVANNHFENITVKNAEDALRINNQDFRDKNDDGSFRATTTGNTFKSLSHENVTDPPVRVLGDMADNKVI